MAVSKVSLAILDDYRGIASPKFARLQSRVDVTSFPETLNPRNEEEKKALIARLQPFQIISTMRERTPLPADVINSLPNLKLVLTTGMRNAAIDMEACSKRGIIVAGTRGLGRSDSQATEHRPPTSLDSTLEHTWALILGLARGIARDDKVVKSGGWQSGFAIGLRGKTLGILGLGKLGAECAKVGILAFGMKVVAWSRNLTQELADEKAKAHGLPQGCFEVAKSKEDVLAAADVLSIHYVLSDRSRGILGAKELDRLKPTALLINTSRGPLVDEAALLSALKRGAIRGAAVDVFAVEPLSRDSEWRTTKWGEEGRSQVLLSPHMGYAEEGAMSRWYDETVDSVETWLEGRVLVTRIN